jgi:hypothetical protein
MHGATIKIINAQQARLNNIYKNTKLKLLKTNAAIWFNTNVWYTISAFVGVEYSVNLQNARCNNKDDDSLV